LSGTKNPGNTNPIAAPRGFAELAIVVAIALPDSPYQAPDMREGEFRMNGYPIAQRHYP